MKVYLEIVGENSSSHVGVLIGVNKESWANHSSLQAIFFLQNACF
jgi:hypothetical protein